METRSKGRLTPATDTGRRSFRVARSGRIRAVAWVVLLGGLIVAMVAGVAWRNLLDRQAEARFNQEATRAGAVISANLARDADLMSSLTGLFTTEPDLTNAQFIELAQSAELDTRFPGGVGFGYIEKVPAADLPAFAARQEADPVTGLETPVPYSVFPDTSPATYCLQRVGAWNVTTVNGFAVPAGFDYCVTDIPGFGPSLLPGELAAATATGTDAVIGPENLIPGAFAIFSPVYRAGAPTTTPEERAAASTGWVAGSFETTALLGDLPDTIADVGIQVTHADASGTQQPVASSGSTDAPGTHQVVVPVAGDPSWQVQVSGTPEVVGMSSTTQGLIVTGSVGAVMVLIFAVLMTLVGSRQRALELVERRTGELAFQAMHDSLTLMPNRALILDRAELLLARSRREGVAVAAMFIDLDDFKSINDTLGHAAGDELLRVVAHRLQETVRASDTVGRLGGDEFVVLVEGRSLSSGPEPVARRIMAALRDPIELEGEPVMMSASIGVADGPRAGADEWLRDADIALYAAKDAGKHTFVVFEASMQEAISERVALERDLTQALEHQQLFLVYQPTFDLGTGRTTGVEALLRWDHPTRGVIEPDDFVPLAEESGTIVPIGRWVLQQACQQAAAWRRQGHQLTMAVNVSGRQLDHDGLLDDVRDALHSSGLDPTSLVLELTETTLMRDAASAEHQLGALKALGIGLAIDDFGTGYSSMAYLQRFPVDAIKIDQTFISGMGTPGEPANLIHALVQLGKTLGLDTLAEGIERPDQLEGLLAEHCDRGQGFLYSRPLSPEQVERFLTTSVS